MNNVDIKDIIKSEINKFVKDSLDAEMKKILKSQNSASREELINLMKNSLESVYKILWQKRDFWKSDIK